MANKNHYSTFCKCRDAYYKKLQAEYDTAIDNATDSYKINAHHIFAQEVLRKEEKHLNSILSNIPNFYHDVAFDTKLNKRLNLSEHFNAKYAALKGKSNSLLKSIGEREGLSLIYDYWHKQDFRSIGNDNEGHTFISDIEWIGKNETEFLLLIRTLHHAGLLRSTSNSKTKLVTDMAKLLNFNLGKNWQVNLSTNIHKRNADYTPPIFDVLKESYQSLRLE